MLSHRTNHTATRQPDGSWTVTWLPGQTLDRNAAITALTLTDLPEDAPEIEIAALAGELDLTPGRGPYPARHPQLTC